MLFEIDHTNVRLAGSMHVVPRGRSIPDWVESCFRWSNALYLEHNEQALAPRLLVSAGQSSEPFFPSEVWQRLVGMWPERLGPVARWKPWIIPPLLALSKLSQDPGVEPRLSQLARAEGRVIQYLETEDEFVGFAESIPSSIYLEGVNRILEKPPTGEQTEALYQAWRRGDVETVTELFAAAPLMQSPILRKTLIEDRNSLWLERIAAVSETAEPTLIVVGAGHLGGERGLLQLLQGMGRATRQLA